MHFAIQMSLALGVIIFCLHTFLPIDVLASSAESSNGHYCIETTGNVIVSRFNTMGVEIPMNTYTAPVSVKLASDGRFKIQLFNHHLYSKRQITFSFDGTNYFYLIGKVDPNKPHPDPWLGKLTSNKEQLCYISAEEMPLILFEDPARDALWYAVCSGAFLKKEKSGEILQLFENPRRSVMGYGYRYKTALTNTLFVFPHNLDIWRDKKLDKRDREEEENRIELDAAGRGNSLYDGYWAGKSGIPDGSHVLNMVWKSDSLLQNQRMPQEIEITTFYPGQTTPTPLYKIKLEFQPWKLSASDGEIFRPPNPAEPTRVSDARVRLRTPGNYVDVNNYTLGTNPTNSAWFSASDNWIQTGVTAALNAQEIPANSPKRHPMLMLLLIPLFLPPIFFLWHAYRKRKNIVDNRHS